MFYLAHMLKNWLKSGLIMGVVALLAGCQLVDTKNPVPAYIEIPSFTFKAGQGRTDSSQAITDAWIYVGGKLLGVYQVPCKVPSLELGRRDIKIYAGIYSDGVRGLRVQYPFYTDYTKDTTLQAGQTYVIKPQWAYRSELPNPFVLQDDFESNNTFVDSIGQFSTLPLLKASEPEYVHSGSRAGIVRSTADTTQLLALGAKGNFSLPAFEQPVYLEFDVKCNLEVTVGLMTYDARGNFTGAINDLVIGNTGGVWKHFYVSLSEEIGQAPQGSRFRPYLAANSGSPGQFIAVDNVRLVSFR